MKIRMSYVIPLWCLTAMLALAQKDPGLEGNWITDGVPAVEAAKKAKKSLSGLPEGTKIKFKVDAKKGKITGTINQLNTEKEFDIEDGKLTDKTFTFKSVEVVSMGFNSGNYNRGGGGGNNAQAARPSFSWKGELTDPNTVTMTRLTDTGEPTTTVLVLKRAPK